MYIDPPYTIMLSLSYCRSLYNILYIVLMLYIEFFPLYTYGYVLYTFSINGNILCISQRPWRRASRWPTTIYNHVHLYPIADHYIISYINYLYYKSNIENSPLYTYIDYIYSQLMDVYYIYHRNP
jgi:hypothetical protein